MLGVLVFVPLCAASGWCAPTAAVARAPRRLASEHRATPLSDGLVKKIDQANKKVTLSHGPLPNGMPAMTMIFRVKDAAWLDQMKEGQKIRFATEEIQGELTVVRFEPAP